MTFNLPIGTGLIPASDSGIFNKFAKECRDQKERDRLRALYMLSIGYTVNDASRVFHVAIDAVYRWAERGNEERSKEDRDRSGEASGTSSGLHHPQL